MSSRGRRAAAVGAANNNKKSPAGSSTAAGHSNSSSSKKKKTNKAPLKGVFTLDRVNDILDFETEHIMMERENRQEHFDTFMYFWNLHPANTVESGRRYARFLIAQILVIACSQKPYVSMMKLRKGDKDDDNDDDMDHDDDDDKNKKSGREGSEESSPVLCLDQWSREHWERLQDEVERLRQVLLRNDATINYSSMNDAAALGMLPPAAAAVASRRQPSGNNDDNSSSDDNDDDDEEDHHDKLDALSPRLGKRFKTLQRYIEINKAIAPIREQLERQIREPIKVSDSDIDDDDNNNNDVVVVETKELIEILEYADEIKDEAVRGAVLRIFHPSIQQADDDDDHDSKTPSLKTRKQLIKILQTSENAYNLKLLQDRLDEFLLKFAKRVFGNADVPILVKLGYTMPSAADDNDSVVDNGNHDGDDNDDESTTRCLFEASDSGRKKKKAAPAAAAAAAVHGGSRVKDNDKHRSSSRRRTRLLPKELKELKRGRDALNNNHGDDPREESLRIMEQAKQAAGLKNKRRQRKSSSSGGRRREEDDEDDENHSPRDDDDDEDSGLEQHRQQQSRSGSATQKRQGTKRKEVGHILDASSSDESDDVLDSDEELEREHAAITISNVPKKKKVRAVAANQSKIYGLPPPDVGIFDDNGNVLKRTRWTADENQAIKQGVTKYGVGKWSEIKQEYGQTLHNRNTVQIKDRYRTMVKNNEL